MYNYMFDLSSVNSITIVVKQLYQYINEPYTAYKWYMQMSCM